jgi:hypothetical protein
MMATISSVLAAQRRKWRRGSSLPYCRRVCANSAPVSRLATVFVRIFARKIRNTVALPSLAAVSFGDKVCKIHHIHQSVPLGRWHILFCRFVWKSDGTMGNVEKLQYLQLQHLQLFQHKLTFYLEQTLLNMSVGIGLEPVASTLVMPFLVGLRFPGQLGLADNTRFRSLACIHALELYRVPALHPSHQFH